jgi:hypothetical protein
MEEICQFCQAVKKKDETANSCCRSGKVVLAPLHDPPQGFKQLYEDPLFLIMVRSYNSNFAFTSMGASLAENVRVEQLANAREGVYTCCVLGTICHRAGLLPPIESSISAFARLYVFDSSTEEQVNMRCCNMDGLDRKIVATIQLVVSKLNSFVEMLLRGGEFIRDQEVLSVRLAIHEAPGVDWRTHNSPTCNEVAAISHYGNVGAVRDIILHRRCGGLQRF